MKLEKIPRAGKDVPSEILKVGHVRCANLCSVNVQKGMMGSYRSFTKRLLISNIDSAEQRRVWLPFWQY